MPVQNAEYQPAHQWSVKLSMRILIVEDNSETREMLEEYFRSRKISASVAYDGINALEILKENEFDIILTDIRMPRMNGFDLVKQVKQAYPRIGIIIMTAFMSVYNEGDIRDIGVDDFITKPFELNSLQDKIEQLYIQLSILKEKRDQQI